MLYLVPIMIESMHCLFIKVVNMVEVYNKILKFNRLFYFPEVFVIYVLQTRYRIDVICNALSYPTFWGLSDIPLPLSYMYVTLSIQYIVLV